MVERSDEAFMVRPGRDEMDDRMRVLQSEQASLEDRHAAVTSIVEDYRGVLLSQAVHIVGPAGAEDAVQDTFVSVLKGAPTFRPGYSLGGWLATINRNRCIDTLRRGKTIRESPYATMMELLDDEADRTVPPFEDPADHAIRQEFHELCAAALRALPALQREALSLSIAGYSQSEIAAKLDVPLGTAKARIRRAKDAIKEVDGLGDLAVDS